MKYIVIAISLIISNVVAADDFTNPHPLSTGSETNSDNIKYNLQSVKNSIEEIGTAISAIETDVSKIDTGTSSIVKNTDANGLTLMDIYASLTAIGTSLDSIDEKLTTISPATISKQLVCSVPTTATCKLSTKPNVIKYYKFSYLVEDGWRAVSVSGTALIFNKYE